VENYGVDPDVEVDITPADWARGRDPQLETAVRLALEALDKAAGNQPARPADRPAQGPHAAATPARPERPGVTDTLPQVRYALRYLAPSTCG
jgi:tricorn protease